MGRPIGSLWNLLLKSQSEAAKTSSLPIMQTKLFTPSGKKKKRKKRRKQPRQRSYQLRIDRFLVSFLCFSFFLSFLPPPESRPLSADWSGESCWSPRPAPRSWCGPLLRSHTGGREGLLSGHCRPGTPAPQRPLLEEMRSSAAVTWAASAPSVTEYWRMYFGTLYTHSKPTLSGTPVQLNSLTGIAN